MGDKKKFFVLGLLGVLVLVVSGIQLVSNLGAFHCVYELTREGVCGGKMYTQLFVGDVTGVLLGGALIRLSFRSRK